MRNVHVLIWAGVGSLLIDLAAVSLSTAGAISDLELIASIANNRGDVEQVAMLHSAIDRLIVLDTGKPTVKDSFTVEPLATFDNESRN